MRQIITTIAAVLSAVCLLNSCAVSSKISTEVSENAKNQTPPEGKSLVYVYRISSLGFAVGLNVSLNDKMLASFYPKRFYLCTLDPGKYVFTGHGENEDDIILTIEPNKKYYIEARPKMGFASARIELELHDQIDGNNDVQKCKMIGSTDAVLPIASHTVKNVQIQQNISQPDIMTLSLKDNSKFVPTKQGNFVLSGGTGLQFISGNNKYVYDGKTQSENKFSSISFVPSFAYFFTDNLAIGLTGKIATSTNKNVNGNKSISSSTMLLPTALYYFPMEGKIRPFAQVGVGLSSQNYKYIPKSGSDTKNSDSGLAINLGGGIAYFIIDNISMNFGISYTKTNLTDGDDDKSEVKQSNYASNIGFSIYL